MKTKKLFSPKKTLLIATLLAGSALPVLHASGLPSESMERFDLFHFSTDSQWFAQFGNFQSPYSGYFSLESFALPAPKRILPAAQPVQGPVYFPAPQATPDRPTYYASYSSSGSYSSAAAVFELTVVPPIEAVSAEEPVIQSVSVPAETAADSVAPVPRRLVAPPPAPTKKPVFSNL